MNAIVIDRPVPVRVHAQTILSPYVPGPSVIVTGEDESESATVPEQGWVAAGTAAAGTGTGNGALADGAETVATKPAAVMLPSELNTTVAELASTLTVSGWLPVSDL